MKTYPLKASHLVSIDPKIKGGLCCIDGTRMTTEIMAAWINHESIVCDQYDISFAQLNAAKRYERQLKNRNEANIKRKAWGRN